MNKITIATFNQPIEAHVLKGKLESEGIPCFLVDELTVQTYHLYSNAIGGVKLQVDVENAEKALKILKESGYHVDKEPGQTRVDRFIDKFNQASGYRRIFHLCLLILALLFIIGLVYAIMSDTTDRLLTQNKWYLMELHYDNKVYTPFTLSYDEEISVQLGYHEYLQFLPTGGVKFPGFNGPVFKAEWMLRNDSLVIMNAELLPNMINGNYVVEKQGGLWMTLSSDKSVKYCQKSL